MFFYKLNSFYSEENVWKMCDRMHTSNKGSFPNDVSPAYVVFISNAEKMV